MRAERASTVLDNTHLWVLRKLARDPVDASELTESQQGALLDLAAMRYAEQVPYGNHYRLSGDGRKLRKRLHAANQQAGQ